MVIVAVGEIGDKTQLLALVLAARFGRPVTIISAIAAATLINHSIAALVGEWVRAAAGPEFLRAC
jgi:Ca2+/H+ antiporter, TMEM165/GDT1 family